jgi:ATP-binding cassette subfamily B multidrug efflux pump
MLRLAKYLKPYLLLIVLAIGLLFVQANADLALPDYLARIVNTGIQLSGIENAVPQAIRQSTMDKITIFMSAQDKASVLADYTLVDKNSADYAQLVTQYPDLANEPIYVLNQISQAEVDKLNPIIAQPLLIVSTIEQAIANPAQAATFASQLGLSQIPAGTDPFTFISQLPPAAQVAVVAKINGFAAQKIGGLSGSMLTQAAAISIKAEYIALGMDVNKMELNYLLRVGAQMLGLVLLSGVCTVLVSLLAARTAAGMGRDVRKAQFEKVEDFSSTEIDKFSTTSLINRSTNDITQVQLVVFLIIRMVLYAPIIGIGAMIHAFRLDTSMWWIIALAVGVLLTIIIVVFAIALPKFRSIQNLIDRLALVLRENLSGMMVIRAFNRQDFELDRFEKANVDLTSTMLFINRIMIVMMPLMMLIMNGLSISIIWIGSHQVAQANMQVGDMLAFMQYTMQVVFAFLMLSMMFIFLPRAYVAGNRIADVLETDPVIKDPKEPQRFMEPFKGLVEFRNVSFHYPDAEEDVLHDITFVAKPGQTTAFIGSTGSGKSTVVNLIPRFYDVSAGSILLDGIDIRQVTQHDLHDKIGYIPQKGVLFSGTIASNLRYADENASEDTLKEATDIAQATEFILGNGDEVISGNGYHNGNGKGNGNGNGIPGGDGHGDGAVDVAGDDVQDGTGFDTEIAQGGTNVSGGQKQRLSIARALVKKPPIYIFDDSFSAVDFKTDAALRRALKQKTTGSTILIVTQRVSTIKNAEQIIVLEEGRIIGKGTHQELMQDCKAYQEIALSQLSQEELL